MEVPYRVHGVTAMFMVIVALLIDGLQALLTITVVLAPVATVVTVFSGFLFWMWFSIFLHVPYTSGGNKKVLIALASTVAELIPIVNMVPATTAGVIGVIVQSRIEDRRKHQGGTVTARTALAAARLERMKRAQAARAESAREERDAAQQARHGAANDNEEPGSERDAA